MQDDISKAYEAYKFIKENKRIGSHTGLLLLEALFANEYSQVQGEFEITLYSGWMEVSFWSAHDSLGWGLIGKIEDDVKILFQLLKDLHQGYSHTIKVIVSKDGVIRIVS